MKDNVTVGTKLKGIEKANLQKLAEARNTTMSNIARMAILRELEEAAQNGEFIKINPFTN